MGILVLPVSAAYLALSLPAMKVIAPASSSPELLAAALASLGVGLFLYSGFLLLARAFYALGDSRTPALVALGSAVIGSVGGDRRRELGRWRAGTSGDARSRAQRGVPFGCRGVVRRCCARVCVNRCFRRPSGAPS